MGIRRGYELWLAGEAKKRNPDIKLGALGRDRIRGRNPRSTPSTGFLLAKSEFCLTFDFIGLWNERPVTSEHFGWLKEVLKEAGLDPLIVGGDNFASRTVSDLEVRK